MALHNCRSVAFQLKLSPPQPLSVYVLHRREERFSGGCQGRRGKGSGATSNYTDYSYSCPCACRTLSSYVLYPLMETISALLAVLSSSTNNVYFNAFY